MKGWTSPERDPDETWHIVDRLLVEALERPSSERRAWLETSAPDPRLAREVLSLIEEVESSGHPLESRDDGWLRRLWEELGSSDPEADDPLVGTRVSSYRLVRRLGTGGMGSVYLAERDEGQFEHRVAVKLLRPGFESSEDLRRFRAERSILASLAHPNIALLLDAGTTPEGRPFIVMEYVEGVPLTEYVERERPDLEETLDLVLTIAAAVEHAHRHLVVHRDLKPSNVLVRPDGVVKLLDFGIARWLEEQEDPERTRSRLRAMTPVYAAPEQFLGHPVTTATDVYQLGAVLYELLTGRPPFGRALDPRELERCILEEPPLPPERVLTERGDTRRSTWARRIGGDLSTVVLKALRKEPERRYTSASAFSSDLRRVLERRPITARPDTLTYRMGRAARRHPWLVPVAVAASLVAVLYVATLVRYTRTVERERAVAEEVQAFLVDLLQPADPRRSDGRTLTARDLVEEGAERVRTELSGQPEVQVRLAGVMGESLSALADDQAAYELYRFRLERIRELSGERSEAYALALRDLGVAATNVGDLPRADSLLTRAIALQQESLGPEHPLLGFTILQRGVTRTSMGNMEAAEADFDRWLPIFRATTPEPTPEYLNGLETLYYVRLAQGRGDEAVDIAEGAVELTRASLPEENPMVAQALALQADAQYQQGRDREAIGTAHRALEIFESAFGPGGHSTTIELSLALALSWDRLGRPDSAAHYYRRVIALETSPVGSGASNLITPFRGLGTILADQGRHAAARDTIRRALAISDSLLGSGNPLSGAILVDLAGVAEAEGDSTAAERLYRSALAGLEGSRGWIDARLDALGRLADLYDEWGRPTDAAIYRARRDSLEAGVP